MNTDTLLQPIIRPELIGTPVSIWYDEEWEEYQVRVEGAPESSTHFTDDLWDAVDTSRYIAKNLDQYLEYRGE